MTRLNLCQYTVPLSVRSLSVRAVHSPLAGMLLAVELQGIAPGDLWDMVPRALQDTVPVVLQGIDPEGMVDRKHLADCTLVAAL